MKLDAETVFFKLFDYVKTNINNLIAELNNEKTDFELENFDSNSFYSGSLDEKVLSFNQVIFAYIANQSAIVNGPTSTENMTIEFDIILHQQSDFNDYKRMLRLQRVLKEVISKAWGKVLIGYDYPEINILNPIDITLFNSSFESKVIGAQVQFEFSN